MRLLVGTCKLRFAKWFVTHRKVCEKSKMTSPKWTSIVNRQASTTQHGHKNVTQKHVNKRHNICRICQTSRAQNISKRSTPRRSRRSWARPTVHRNPPPRLRPSRPGTWWTAPQWPVGQRMERSESRGFCVSLRKLLWDFFWFFRDEVRFASSALDSKSLLLAVQFFSSFQRDGVEANKGKWILFIILSSFCTFSFHWM